MIDESLLCALADGEFHSGQVLGERLGISRSAVWKQIKELQAMGVEVYSVRGRGYRVPDGFDLLCEQQVAQGCNVQTSARLRGVHLQRIADSTNLLARRALLAGESERHLYLAEYQTAGRGRRGRSWVSPFASNLYFSLVWGFSQGAAALEGLSLVVGLALVKALEQQGCNGVQVKWPNDLLAGGRKLAGILLEVQGDAAGDCQVVIGVGVNVAMPEVVKESIDQPWTDLRALLPQLPSRNMLMAAILNQLVPVLEEFSQTGFAGFRAEWERYHAYQNRPVTLHTGGQQVTGVCLGVNEQGALIVEQSGEMLSFHAGEVSVRSADAT